VNRNSKTLFGFPESLSPRKIKSSPIKTQKDVALQCSPLISENKYLTDRISVQDKALLRLHQEHAKLVEQLQTLKSKNVEDPSSPISHAKGSAPSIVS